MCGHQPGVTSRGSPEAESGGRAVSGSCVPLVFVISCVRHSPGPGLPGLTLALTEMFTVSGAGTN